MEDSLDIANADQDGNKRPLHIFYNKSKDLDFTPGSVTFLVFNYEKLILLF